MRTDRIAVEHIGERRGRIGERSEADSQKGEAYWPTADSRATKDGTNGRKTDEF